MKRGSRRGCFRLKRAIIGIDDDDDCTFTIRVDNRVYHFQGMCRVCAVRACTTPRPLSPAPSPGLRGAWTLGACPGVVHAAAAPASEGK